MPDVHPQDDPLTQPSAGPASTRSYSRGHVRSFARGRTCSTEACETVLSRYNESGLCWVHTGAGTAAGRRP